MLSNGRNYSVILAEEKSITFAKLNPVSGCRYGGLC
jgi:hypothetical protein